MTSSTRAWATIVGTFSAACPPLAKHTGNHLSITEIGFHPVLRIRNYWLPIWILKMKIKNFGSGSGSLCKQEIVKKGKFLRIWRDKFVEISNLIFFSSSIVCVIMMKTLTLLFNIKRCFLVWCEKGEGPDLDPWDHIITDPCKSGSGTLLPLTHKKSGHLLTVPAYRHLHT